MIYQPIGIIIGVLGLIIAFIRFREGKSSLRMLSFWIILWSLIIVVSIYPDSTTFFANIFGIGRGLDLILILGIVGCYYLIFKIYTMIEQVESEITNLVREIALNNENNTKEIKKNIEEKKNKE